MVENSSGALCSWGVPKIFRWEEMKVSLTMSADALTLTGTLGAQDRGWHTGIRFLDLKDPDMDAEKKGKVVPSS